MIRLIFLNNSKKYVSSIPIRFFSNSKIIFNNDSRNSINGNKKDTSCNGIHDNGSKDREGSVGSDSKNKLNLNANSKQKRIVLPPSFRTSSPMIPENQLSDNERSRILNTVETAVLNPTSYKSSWYSPFVKFFIFLVPCFVFGSGFIIYETVINKKPVFLPICINSSIPLEKISNFEDIDVNLIKEISKATILKRLSLNHKIIESFGLPLTLGDYEDFEIRIEFNKLAIEGIEIDFRKSWLKPVITYKEIDTPILPSDFNKFIQPLKVNLNGEIDEDPEDDSFLEKKDYKLKIRATIKVVNEHLHRIEPGSGKITFNAEIDLDHTKMIKITSALMHYRNKNGSGSGGTLEKLW